MLADYFVSKYIKDHKNTEDEKVRLSYGVLSSIAGLIINFILFLVELIMGTLINSIAVTADAFHNLADVTSSVITLAGFKLSSKPADREHPFGHGRIEYLAALLVAALILVVGVNFIESSFSRIIKPESVRFNLVSFFIIIVAVPFKLYLSHFNKYMGEKIDSSALKAAGVDAFNDVMILLGVIISLLVSGLGHIYIDGYVGIMVAIMIILSGISIMKETINPLLGQTPDPKLVDEIERLVMGYDVIIGVHDLIIHNYGPGRSMASLHAEVPYNVPIMTIHSQIDKAEKEISDKLNIFAVIHMDPVNTDSKEIASAREEVESILKSFPEISSIHDFRVVGEGKNKNLIFDAVVPFRVKISKEGEELLKQRVANQIKKVHPGYNAIITIDRNYTSED